MKLSDETTGTQSKHGGTSRLSYFGVLRALRSYKPTLSWELTQSPLRKAHSTSTPTPTQDRRLGLSIRLFVVCSGGAVQKFLWENAPADHKGRIGA